MTILKIRKDRFGHHETEDKILYYLNQFGRPLSPALWPWPKSDTCPLSLPLARWPVLGGRSVTSERPT